MIRKAQENDLPRLAELFSELHEYHCHIFPEEHKMPSDEGFFLTMMKKMLSDSENTVLVNTEDGVINAYAVIKNIDVTFELKPPRKVCYIDQFGVSKRYRRSGIGTALFRQICGFARENGCDRIQLGVSAPNESAMRFYEKMGLVPRTIVMSKKI